jgi:T5SS/PEP-CTERM-associated repeat protein
MTGLCEAAWRNGVASKQRKRPLMNGNSSCLQKRILIEQNREKKLMATNSRSTGNTEQQSLINHVRGLLLKHALHTILPVAAAALLSASMVQAAVNTTGDVTANPLAWTGTTTAYVGNAIDGTLTINDRSTVTSSKSYVGEKAGATGTVNIDGAGSQWNSASFIQIGDYGKGILNVTNGGAVSFVVVRAAVFSGSTGIINIDGAGSTVTSVNGLMIGTNNNMSGSATGVLSITNGGSLVNTGWNSSIASNTASTGIAVVDGVGSKWTNSIGLPNRIGSTLYVGNNGTGKLSISDGGAVTADTVSVNAQSGLTIDVGKGSSLTIGSGTGTFTNNGTTRLVAGAGASSGTYTPIAYGTRSGNAPQALGGIWNDTAHTITVADSVKATGVGGAATSFDLAAFQRALITDSLTGKSAGAGFLGTTTSTPLTFTATAIGGSELASLETLITGEGKGVLSGWDFSTTGYTVSSTTPVYLSLWADTATDLSDLTVWHYDGSIWSKFDATDLAFDGTYASFSATSFSGYAVSGTAPVPVPSALFLLGPGLAGLAFMRRRIFSA